MNHTNPASPATEMVIRRSVTVTAAEGIHARPANLLVKLASQFKSRVSLIRNNDRFDCDSVWTIMMLAAVAGTELEIEAQGDDAEAAADAIAKLITDDFPDLAE